MSAKSFNEQSASQAGPAINDIDEEYMDSEEDEHVDRPMRFSPTSARAHAHNRPAFSIRNLILAVLALVMFITCRRTIAAAKAKTNRKAGFHENPDVFVFGANASPDGLSSEGRSGSNFLPSASSNGVVPSTPGTPSTASLSTWMETLPDDALVSDVFIPGTHDSAMFKFSWQDITKGLLLGELVPKDKVAPFPTSKEQASPTSKEVVSTKIISDSEDEVADLERAVQKIQMNEGNKPQGGFLRSSWEKLPQAPWTTLGKRVLRAIGASIEAIGGQRGIMGKGDQDEDEKEFASKNSKQSSHPFGQHAIRGFLQTQDWTFEQQLENGIRSFDLRFHVLPKGPMETSSYFSKNPEERLLELFPLVHAFALSGDTLLTAFLAFEAFLEKNPNEFLIVRFKDETEGIRKGVTAGASVGSVGAEEMQRLCDTHKKNLWKLMFDEASPSTSTPLTSRFFGRIFGKTWASAQNLVRVSDVRGKILPWMERGDAGNHGDFSKWHPEGERLDGKSSAEMQDLFRPSPLQKLRDFMEVKKKKIRSSLLVFSSEKTNHDRIGPLLKLMPTAKTAPKSMLDQKTSPQSGQSTRAGVFVNHLSFAPLGRPDLFARFMIRLARNQFDDEWCRSGFCDGLVKGRVAGSLGRWSVRASASVIRDWFVEEFGSAEVAGQNKKGSVFAMDFPDEKIIRTIISWN